MKPIFKHILWGLFGALIGYMIRGTDIILQLGGEETFLHYIILPFCWVGIWIGTDCYHGANLIIPFGFLVGCCISKWREKK